jgi:hypothetical protein
MKKKYPNIYPFEEEKRKGRVGEPKRINIRVFLVEERR